MMKNRTSDQLVEPDAERMAAAGQRIGVEVSVVGEPVRADDHAAAVTEARSRDDRYTVRSVQRALQLLEIVASEPQSGLSLTEIARTLGVSKSTTLATARTLTAHGSEPL
jgi:hypothetical protein